MGKSEACRFTVFSSAVLLTCAGFLAACSEAPRQPAPVFALPASEIIGAPRIEGQEPEAATAQSSTRQLHYIAVPPGQKVAGMARAHLILKPAHRHRPAHAHKTRHLGAQSIGTIRSPAKPAAELPNKPKQE